MTERPAPDYHGPVGRDGEGNDVSVTDVVHERFHESVKDVLAGKVLPAAREQMKDALKEVADPPPPPPFPVSR